MLWSPRRTTLFLIAAMAILAAPIAGAQLVAETGLHTSVGFFGAYAGWSNSVVVEAGPFRAGGGVELYTGTTQFDMHLVPFARGEIGWGYLNAGWIFQIADRTSRVQQMDDALWLALGIAPDLLPLATGRIGFDLGLEAIVRIGASGDGDLPAENVIDPLGIDGVFGGGLREVLLFVAGSMQGRLGLIYSFGIN